MTVTISLNSKEEEQTLLNFLDRMHYQYQQDDEDFSLTDEQKLEILRRDANFASGKTSARDWSEIKSELKRVYN